MHDTWEQRGEVIGSWRINIQKLSERKGMSLKNPDWMPGYEQANVIQRKSQYGHTSTVKWDITRWGLSWIADLSEMIDLSHFGLSRADFKAWICRCPKLGWKNSLRWSVWAQIMQMAKIQFKVKYQQTKHSETFCNKYSGTWKSHLTIWTNSMHCYDSYTNCELEF